MIGFKANDCKKNRRKVDFYNHVAATTPCAMKTGLHVEGFGATVKSLCTRTASFLDFFTFGRRSDLP